MLGMGPPQQRLDRRHRAGAQVKLGLVAKHELVLGDRGAQAVGEPEQVAVLVHGRVIARVCVARELGAVHREVRPQHEPLGVLGVSRRVRDPDARSDLDTDGLELERILQRVAEPLRDRLGLRRPGVQEQRRELVPAQAHQRIAVPQRLAEPLSQQTQQLVPDRVAERIVDLLEPVEVYEQEREAAGVRVTPVLLGEPRVQDVEQRPPVAQAGELVGDRLTVALEGERTQGTHQFRQAHPGEDEGGRGQPDRHRSRVAKAPNDQHDECGQGGDTGKREAGGLSVGRADRRPRGPATSPRRS